MTITPQSIKGSIARIARRLAGAATEFALRPVSTFVRPFDITTTSTEPLIPLQSTKSGWFPIAIVLSPLVPFGLLLYFPSTRPPTIEFVTKNWGSIASVVGLIITGITLWVARKAKEAAEAANQESRRRNLSEDLQGAHAKAQEVGQFI